MTDVNFTSPIPLEIKMQYPPLPRRPFFLPLLVALILAAGLVVAAHQLAGQGERTNESTYRINKEFMSEQLQRLHSHREEVERG